jgi:DNA-directed RNA polymerase specialized sigma subunit
MKKIYTDISDAAEQSWKCQREKFDLVRGRLNLLKGKEKIIMAMYIEKGNSIRQIARLMGVDEMKISRKIQKLTHTLSDGTFIKCIKKRDKLSLREMSIARDYFLNGSSIRQIANKNNWSFYRVRQKLQEIKHTIK